MPEIRNPNLQSQGPGGGGGGKSSTMFLWLLMLMILVGYEMFFNKPTPSPAPQSQSQSAPGAAAAPAVSPQGQPPTSGGKQSRATATVSAASETETTVENELYKIVLTNRGGLVKHWILKRYYDTAGKPLDLVQPQASAQFGFPLSLFTYDQGLTTQLNQTLYQVTGAGAASAGTVLAPTAVSYHYSANGLDVVKTLHFDSSYVVEVDTEVKRNGAPVRALVEWPAGLGDMEEFLPKSLTRLQVRTSAASQVAMFADGKQDLIVAKKVSSNATFTDPYAYAGIMDLYFAAAFLPDAPEDATVVTLHHTIDLPSNLSETTSQKTPADVIGLAIGSTSGVTRLRLFAGPKETDVLSSIHAMGLDGKADGQSLSPLIHFGWFTVIAKPLYLAMRFLHGLLGLGAYSWGWAIVIVAFVINLVMLPTRLMMMKSSLKMMRIQPKVEAIKKRFAHLKMNDPKRAEMNTEMMALYKTEGVNMYGSCLPMLIQMPLLYAVYEVLENVIELRQAHWLWIPDLSAPDPSYVLPALFILTMFLVQYITPSPGMDPAQRRMMAFVMPVIFGFTLFHFPSGLALYWFLGNLINLAIQVSINRSQMGKEMHAIAARRAAKKSGSKVIQGRR